MKKWAQTCVFCAAQNGHLDVLDLLVSHRGDIHRCRKDGASPLYIAAQHGNMDMCKKLLQLGASSRVALSCGAVALHVAAHRGHTDLVELLVKNGDDVNAQDLKGTTPLYEA